MKKAKKAARRPIGRVGKKPVIAVRVPAPLHQRITESAKRNGRGMSEEMAALLESAFDWQDAHGDRVRMLQEAKAQCERLVGEQLNIEMKRIGWKPLLGSPYWLPPGVAPQNGFIGPETATDAPDELTAINAVIDALEVRIAKLKAQARTRDGDSAPEALESQEDWDRRELAHARTLTADKAADDSAPAVPGQPCLNVPGKMG